MGTLTSYSTYWVGEKEDQPAPICPSSFFWFSMDIQWEPYSPRQSGQLVTLVSAHVECMSKGEEELNVAGNKDFTDIHRKCSPMVL